MRVGGLLVIVFCLSIITGLVFIILEGVKAQDNERQDKTTHESRRDAFFQSTVVLALLAVVINLPFGGKTKK
jgi:uncharacterized membrane protein